MIWPTLALSQVRFFSEVYLEPSRLSMMQRFAKIAESHQLFLKTNSIIDVRLSSKYGSAFTNTPPTSCFFNTLFLLM